MMRTFMNPAPLLLTALLALARVEGAIAQDAVPPSRGRGLLTVCGCGSHRILPSSVCAVRAARLQSRCPAPLPR